MREKEMTKQEDNDTGFQDAFRLLGLGTEAVQLRCSGRLNARAFVGWLAVGAERAGVSQTRWRRACIPVLEPSQTSYLFTMHQCLQVNIPET